MRIHKPVIVIGGGDHAKVLLDILLGQDIPVAGIVDTGLPAGSEVYGVPVIGGDEAVLHHAPDEVKLVNGIGSTGSTALRTKVYDRFKMQGYSFAMVIHPSAIISGRARLCEGVQVLAGAVINTDAVIGADSIVNTNASVDHGCTIGENVHIAPGCTLSGCVAVGSGTHIGTGSSVIQGITIGSNVLIGAGSVVLDDIEDNAKVYGVPAKIQNPIYETDSI